VPPICFNRAAPVWARIAVADETTVGYVQKLPRGPADEGAERGLW